ncbi:MAG: HD-GYP domain-containing protein [Deltaproteobacteria bacterium]|nr:HD-GYP domain-containing protein [Deltaproteobacteria bacterium]
MIKTISVQQLKVGMYIEDLGISWLRHPFARARWLIKSQEEIKKIKQCGLSSIKIDTIKGIGVDPPTADQLQPPAISLATTTPLPKGAEPEELTAESLAALADTVSVQDEIIQVARVYNEFLIRTRTFFSQVQLGLPINLDEISSDLDELIKSVFRNRYAASALVKLKTFDEYTYTHSVNVCVLALTLGRFLNLPLPKLKALGIGGLFHDLGKIAISKKIVNKPGPLTVDELREIQKHPYLSAKLLKTSDQVSREVIECALLHHERYCGQGYPQGLRSNEIPLSAQIIGLADVYDAMTSDRVYRKKFSQHETLKTMYAARGEEFDPILVSHLVKCLGVYPVGSLVHLNTGEKGLVMDINDNDLIKPKILLIDQPGDVTRNGPQVFDLVNQPEKKSNEVRRIVGVDAPGKWNIDPARYLLDHHSFKPAVAFAPS